MKVIRKQATPQPKVFEALIVGDIFRLANSRDISSLYIKVELPGTNYNAVRLQTGSAYNILPEEWCYYQTAMLEVEDK